MLRSSLMRLSRRAAVVGGATVAATTASVALCDAASAPVPKFVLGGDRYDQTTFQGRLTKIQELIDMRTLLLTDAEVASAQSLLSEYKKLGACPVGVSDDQMWDAQRTVGAVIHGPTGEKMNIFGRMSMFVPANVPIAAGLLMSKSVYATLFWQWWNQTYNVFNNYVNRAGPTVEMGPLLQSCAPTRGLGRRHRACKPACSPAHAFRPTGHHHLTFCSLGSFSSAHRCARGD